KRRQLAEAAEKRQMEASSRGIKNINSVEQKKKKQEEIEKRMAASGSGGEGGLRAEISSSIAASAGQEVPLVTETGFNASIPQRCVCPRGQEFVQAAAAGLLRSFTGYKGCWNGEFTVCRQHGGGWGFSFLSAVFVQTCGVLVLSAVAGGVKRGFGREEDRCLLPVTCQFLQQSGTYSSCGFCCLHTKAQQYFAIVEEQM
ncbi:PREDICTED: small VCP/p97-interacting protein, partial [Buceros rhinoceros silvestris]|uniref:small VCP/p97-interacting protein n=1 Tax=Buceros rhinoceros silvestris TaxID=175836 RepID=UPI000528C4CE